MNLRTAAFVLALSLASPFASAESVAFINPGKSEELYWARATNAVQAAADTRGENPGVHYAGRAPPRGTPTARDTAARPPQLRPQYAIVTNDNGIGLGLLKTL